MKYYAAFVNTAKKLKDALEREKYKNNNDDLFTYKYEIIIFTQNINVL